MLATFSRAQWESAGPTALSDELERGRIVFFPECPIALPSVEDQRFLREETARYLKKKNFSYYHRARRLVGIEGDRDVSDRLRILLQQHGERVQTFLSHLMPVFTHDWEVGTTSLRPLQERGRNLSAHASNELVHVDAGAYGATHGDRILRFFVNINPAEDRLWISKGTFPELYPKYGPQARITPPTRPEGNLEPGIGNRMLSGFLGAATGMGITMARQLDTSPYDRVMRRFHNWMKDNPDFQKTPEGHIDLRFPPFSAWMCLTDMVSHACTEGQHALVDTFVIRLESCQLQDQAPYYILKGSTPKEMVPA